MENRSAMASEPDTGLVKRGFVLLAVMVLIVSVVTLILLQGRRPSATVTAARAEDYAWIVAAPTATFPANISWGVLREVALQVPSPAGWEIRHNAAATLARRGSDHVPWPVFREMLDLQRTTVNLREQLANLPVHLKDAQETPEASARNLVAVALRTLAEWHAERRQANKMDVPPELPEIYEIVDQLAESPILELRDQAKKTQSTFFR